MNLLQSIKNYLHSLNRTRRLKRLAKRVAKEF